MKQANPTMNNVDRKPILSTRIPPKNGAVEKIIIIE